MTEVVPAVVSTEELIFVPADEFVADRESGAKALVTGSDGRAAIPANGTVVVYGNGGAGKSTLVNDWTVSFARDESWLDLLHPARPIRVVLIEAEGAREEFQEKLERKLTHHGDLGDGCLLVLSKPWAEFTFADETHRQELADTVVAEEIDLVIVGPVATVGMVGGGTPDEINSFAQLLADLRHRVGRPLAILLVHHENRSGQVSGAWERVPDLLVHVTGQGHGRTRVYFQKSRSSSELHQTTVQLAWADGETYTLAETRPEVTTDTITEQLVAAIRANGGLTWTKLRDLQDNDGQRLIRGTGEQIAAVRDRLLTDGTLVNTAAVDGRYILWTADDPAAPRSDARTDSERLPFAPAATETDRRPFAVRPVRGERQTERTETDEPQTHQNEDTTP